MSELANQKEFYDSHTNFSGRTLTEYNISPGIKCKFDTIKKRLGGRVFNRALDIGCSGNSFIHFLDNVKHRIFCDLAHLPLTSYSKYQRYHPTMGSITDMAYKPNTFDLITALDVLEHIPDDQSAASDLVRVLKPKGLLVITVPHRMEYFTEQDRICGHVRRYEYSDIQEMFTSRGLQELTVFPVYGQFMKAQAVQEANPEKTEQSINNLRMKYSTDKAFSRFWDIVVKIGAKFMEWDAKFQPFNKTMDIAVIFRKKGNTDAV